MDINEIHWHDCLIRKVIELPAPDQLLMEVDYPIDWEHNIFEPYTICFSKIYGYEIYESAFHGAPTILDATEIKEKNEFGIRAIRIETNAGYRIVRCKFVSLSKGEVSF